MVCHRRARVLVEKSRDHVGLRESPPKLLAHWLYFPLYAPHCRRDVLPEVSEQQFRIAAVRAAPEPPESGVQEVCAAPLRLDGFCEGDLEVVVRVEADLFPARAAYPVDRLHEDGDVFAVEIAEEVGGIFSPVARPHKNACLTAPRFSATRALYA